MFSWWCVRLLVCGVGGSVCLVVCWLLVVFGWWWVRVSSVVDVQFT